MRQFDEKIAALLKLKDEQDEKEKEHTTLNNMLNELKMEKIKLEGELKLVQEQL